LQGEPGTGKTTIAEAIAYELAVPLYVVRYDQLIGSFLGETASRLKSAFDYIRTTHSVLFFDEFDAIAKERGDIHETGEIKRVVSSLLLQVDSLPSYNVIVAATNHPELLDRATWRRFEVRLALPMPTHEDVAEYLYLNLGTDLGKSAVSAQCLAGRLGAINYADLEQFCLQIRRAQILQIGSSSFEEIVDRTLSQVASESRHQD
jgi:AAA+ superfamily predicted ATPase